LSESRANATIYKAKSKDCGTRPRTSKLSLRTLDVVEEVSQPVIYVVRSQAVQVCGGVMNDVVSKALEKSSEMRAVKSSSAA